MRIVAALFGTMLLVSLAHAAELPRAVEESDYRPANEAQSRLGQLLFYDRVLSGTFRVSCASCHNHDRASSNGFLLDPASAKDVDDLAVNGLPIYDVFKPSSRHAPTLFNLGAREFTSLFSDGRVSEKDGKITSPARNLPAGLRDVLAVQALFPAVTGDELVGSKVESDLSRASHVGDQAVWDILAARVAGLPDYLPYFRAAFEDIEVGDDIEIRHLANAISAFVATEWRSDGSPFDAFLRGRQDALTRNQKRGLALFYGQAGCDLCHSGAFQTNHGYYATASPLWRFDATLADGAGDVPQGRVTVTGARDDLFRFRVPSLRNVTLSAPYGLAGSHKSLGGFLRGHIQPASSLRSFIDQRLDGKTRPDDVAEIERRLITQNQMPSVTLGDDDVSALVEFLESLTDRSAVGGVLGKPQEVPSSLVVE